MSNHGKWETVGGSGKRGKAASNGSDSQRKAGDQPMATMTTKDPLAPMPTQFEGFRRKELAAQRAAEAKKNEPSPKAAKSTGKVAAKKPAKPTFIPPKEAVAKMNGNDLENELGGHLARFDDTMVRLKLLSTYLQDQFIGCDPLDSDPSLSTQAPGFPFLCASMEVRRCLVRCMSDLEEHVRIAFYKMCVDQLLHQAKTGHQMYGWRMLVQAISHVQPNIHAICVESLANLVKPCANQPRHCIPLLWCFEQGVASEPDTDAFAVWHKAYFCTLPERNIAAKVQSYALDRLKLLIGNAQRQPDQCSSLPHQLLVDMLQLALGKAHNPPPTVLQDVQKLYPTIRDVFFKQEDADVAGLFEALLPMLNPQQQQAERQLIDEVYCLLLACLSFDDSCEQAWLDLHRKNVQQSSFLLKRINASYGKKEPLIQTLNVNGLVQLLRRMESLHGIQGAGSQQMRESSKHCKALLRTVEVEQAALALQLRSQSRWWVLFLFIDFVLVVLIAAVAYDIYSTKSWSGSKTRLYLDQSGLLDAGKRVSGEACSMGAAGVRWLRETVPPYVSHWSTSAEPYFMQAVGVYERGFQQANILGIRLMEWAQQQYTTLSASRR